MDDVADAVARGAAWSRLGPQRWQYLRRVDWCIAHLQELQEDLCLLAVLGQPER